MARADELRAGIVRFGAPAAKLALARIEGADTVSKAALAELLVGLADAGTPPATALVTTAIAIYEALEDGEAKERLLHALANAPVGPVSDARFQLVANAAYPEPIVGAHLLSMLGDARGVGILVELLERNPSMHRIVRGSVVGAIDELRSRAGPLMGAPSQF